MEATNTTSYTALAGATIAKVATDVFSGTQALDLDTIAANEGVQSAVFGHHETGPILVYALIRSSLAGSVILYDESNNTAVKTVTYSANEVAGGAADEWTYVIFQAQAPTSSTSLSVRVTTSEATSTTWFIDHMGAMLPNQLFTPPSQIEDISYLDELMTMPSMLNSRGDSDNYVPSRDFERWPMGQSLRDYEGINSHRFVMEQNTNRPVWIKFRDNEAALTGTTISVLLDTTFAPKKAIVYGAAAELLRRGANKLTGRPRAQKHQEAEAALRVYQSVMASLGLNRPTVKFTTRRVSVPSR